MPKAKNTKAGRGKARAAKKKLTDSLLKDLEAMDKRTRTVKGGGALKLSFEARKLVGRRKLVSLSRDPGLRTKSRGGLLF